MPKQRVWPPETQALRENGCANCGTHHNVELAHLTKRAFDKPRTRGSKTVYVEPESIIPLCGPFPEGCHGAFDRHELDVIHLLSTEQQARAVEDYGSITQALERLCPSAYRRISEQESNQDELEAA